MATQVSAIIRDYAPATDTAAVELLEAGIVDTWLYGVKVDISVNRGYLTYGAPATLSVPDAHRLCEAVVIAVNSPLTSVAKSSGSNVLKTILGRGGLATNGAGAGSAGVTFPGGTFTLAPNVSASVDGPGTTTISGITNAGFTIAVTGSWKPNAVVFFSYLAEGY